MFKLTGVSGRRNASATRQTPRVSGLTALRGRDIATDNRRRPAFLPDTPQEQGFDSDGPRLQGLEKNLGGGEH
jgi:hypothetical protein